MTTDCGGLWRAIALSLSAEDRSEHPGRRATYSQRLLTPSPKPPAHIPHRLGAHLLAQRMSCSNTEHRHLNVCCSINAGHGCKLRIFSDFFARTRDCSIEDTSGTHGALGLARLWVLFCVPNAQAFDQRAGRLSRRVATAVPRVSNTCAINGASLLTQRGDICVTRGSWLRWAC